MIPLYDTVPTRRFPVVTYALIALNVLAFAYEIHLRDGLEDFLLDHGFVAVRFFRWREFGYSGPFDWRRFLPPVTSMFLHGGVWHILGNMLFLRIFGDNVEDRLGRFGFVCAYLACGVFACLAQGLAKPDAGVPMIGASGAIAGVLGTYLVLYPRSRVVTFIPIFIIIPLLVRIPALVFLGLWFLLQLANGWASLGAPNDASGGTAFIAHVAGFVVGGGLGIARRIADGAKR